MSVAPPSRRSWIAALRAELAPSPGRWREATLVALATTTALAVALTLQAPSFAAPNVAFIALQRTTVCTWRNLVRRVLIAVGAGMLLVPLGGVLVQTPWLLVPVFFVAVATVTYGIPSARSPVESILVLFPLVSVCFSGVYDPGGIAVNTRDLVAAEVIGVVSATVFSQLSARPSARRRLAESLAAILARARARLRDTLPRYLADADPLCGTDSPMFSDLGSHVQLLDLARQEGMGAVADRSLVTLTTATERLETFVATIDTLSRHRVGRTYRRFVAAQVTALGAALDVALAAFARAARRLGDDETPSAEAGDEAWPDLAGLVAALRARQLELRHTGDLARVDVAESANLHAVVQSLASIADVLHTPPWALQDFAAAEHLDAPRIWPWSVLPLDRFALRFALQVALGATIALVVGVAAHVPELLTLMWNPLLVAQMSYGATIRKAWLRLGGVLVGGVLALLTIIAVFANTGDVTVWLAVMFVVLLACQYAVLGSPLYWYGPFQVGVTYFVVLVTADPTTDVGAALWRALGTFVGTAILFSIFRLVAPDYAGRQLIARFADLLRDTLVFLPRSGVALAPLADLIAARIAASKASADILRLVEEARLEGRASGIDPTAAVEAAGIALRISLRAGLMARDRATTTRLALPEPGRAHLERLRAAARERLAIDLELLGARHTMALPGTRAHHGACRAARAHAERPRPDVAGPFAALSDYLTVARTGDLADWPPDALSALLAELEHFRRVSELLPQLDAALERMVLPEGAREDARESARGALPLAAVTRP